VAGSCVTFLAHDAANNAPDYNTHA